MCFVIALLYYPLLSFRKIEIIEFHFDLNKIGVREMASAKDIVSSIISAANRKIQRRRKCQDETDNETHEVDKVCFDSRDVIYLLYR